MPDDVEEAHVVRGVPQVGEERLALIRVAEPADVDQGQARLAHPLMPPLALSGRNRRFGS